MADGASTANGEVEGYKTLVINIDLTKVEDLNRRFSETYKLNLEPPKLDKKQSEYRIKLLETERQLNIASGGEPMITVENRVDFVNFPRSFKYTKKNIAGPGVRLISDPAYLVGCECGVNNCSEKNCTCPVYSDGEFAYNDRGRIMLDKRRPIFECNMKCKCEKSCRNRVVQRGRTVRVCIFRTKRKGWGLKTLDYIHANQFVTEYVGEIVTSEEAECRGKTYDKMGQTYLFDLDFNQEDCLYTIDAFRFGNVAHFINHSCDPNLIVYNAWIDNLNPHLPTIALFATRSIQPGEELTFDYTMSSDQPRSPRSSKHMKCQCKASNCRKWLF